MKKLISFFVFYFIALLGFGQKENKTSTYLNSQYTSTIHDPTKGINPWAIGLGFQTFFYTKTKFKPSIEITGDLYLKNDKVLLVFADGSTIESIRSVVNLFGGGSFQANKNIYFSFLGGPSFINGKTLLGIKPSIGLYFSKDERCTVKVSYINIFNRSQVVNQNFSSISFSVGLKLF